VELYETDEQKVEALKKWWQENGKALLIGITVGIAAILGWNYWRHYQKDQALQASALYGQLLKAMAETKEASAKELAVRIQSQFNGSDYAVLSGLMLARLKVKEQDFAAAKGLLEKLLGSDNKELANIARIRLVRILLANKEYEQGLKLINDVDQTASAGFAGIYDELVGDLYVALDRPDQARTSYQSALRNGQQSPLLQMKIDDLTAPEKLGK